MGIEEIVLEELPEHVVASMEVRDRFMSELGGEGSGLEFLVDDLQKWRPGQTVTVAFLDGSDALCLEVAAATKPITAACNIKLDFGPTGTVRRWLETDTQYAADIRVSFDKKGYFSLVGTDSVNATIGGAAERVGGRPRQCSLNLGGFTFNPPAGWEGTVRHEFLHALAFHHEHQNMQGDCQDEFRWDDDPGYQPITNAKGVFVADSQGRRPGIYTYLAGQPNQWPASKVDRNLRPLPGGSLASSAFDQASIMLYRFPDIFYRTHPSPCAPIGTPNVLSPGDRAGLQHLYPSDPGAAQLVEIQLAKLQALVEPSDEGLESTDGLADDSELPEHLLAALAVYERKGTGN